MSTGAAAWAGSAAGALAPERGLQREDGALLVGQRDGGPGVGRGPVGQQGEELGPLGGGCAGRLGVDTRGLGGGIGVAAQGQQGLGQRDAGVGVAWLGLEHCAQLGLGLGDGAGLAERDGEQEAHAGARVGHQGVDRLDDLAGGHAAAQHQGGVGIDGGQEAGVLAQAAAQRLLGLVHGAATAQDLGEGHERAVGTAADGGRIAAGPVAHLQAAAQQRLLAVGVASGERLLEDDVGEAREDLEDLVAHGGDVVDAPGVAQGVDVARGQRRRVASLLTRPAARTVVQARSKCVSARMTSPVAAYSEPRLKCRKGLSTPSATWRSRSSRLRLDLSFVLRTEPR